MADMVPTPKMEAAGRAAMARPGSTPRSVYIAMWRARPTRNGMAARVKYTGNGRGDVYCPQCGTEFEAIIG